MPPLPFDVFAIDLLAFGDDCPGEYITAGFCGLAVLSMAVTYLIEVQEGIARRDAGVLKITTASGQPPSALGLLERYADLDAPEEMRRAPYDGRDWCALVLNRKA